MPDILELQKKHNERVKYAMELGAKENLDAEESVKFEELLNEAEEFSTQIKREQRLLAARAEGAELVTAIGGDEGQRVLDKWENPTKKSQMINERFKERSLSHPGQKVLYSFPAMADIPDLEKYALSTAAASAGDLIDSMLSADLFMTMKAFAGILNTRATIVRTTTGGAWSQMTKNNTSRKAAIVAEAGDTTEGDPSYDAVSVPVYTYRAGTIASREAMQDTSIDLAADQIANLGEAFGRGYEEHAVEGSGTDQPHGISNNAHDVVSTDASGVDSDDIINVEAALDVGYRANAEWLIGQPLLTRLKQLSLGDRANAPGFPLWLPSMAVGSPSTILGYPYTLSPEMNDGTTANAVYAVFGDLSYYVVRIAAEFEILFVDQLYAKKNQVAWYGFARFGGRPVLTTTVNADKPIKMMTAA